MTTETKDVETEDQKAHLLRYRNGNMVLCVSYQLEEVAVTGEIPLSHTIKTVKIPMYYCHNIRLALLDGTLVKRADHCKIDAQNIKSIKTLTLEMGQGLILTQYQKNHQAQVD